MSNIINMEPRRGNSICTISCVYNVLSFYGIPMTEYEAYILVNGFQTSFYKGYVALNTLGGINENLRLNGGFETTWLNHEVNKQEIIIKSIIHGSPAIVLIDSGYLIFDERLKKEYDFLRSFVIYGVDLEKNVFLVYDMLHLNKDQEIEVINFTIPINYLIDKAKEFLIIYSDQKKIMQYDYKKILIKNIKKYIKNDSASEVNQDCGIDAVKYHISYMEEVLAKNYVADKLEACYYATNTILYGTFMPMTNYLLEFLKDYKITNKYAFADELKILKSKWNILSNKAMKLTVSKRENQSLQFLNNYELTFYSMMDFLQKLVEILGD